MPQPNENLQPGFMNAVTSCLSNTDCLGAIVPDQALEPTAASGLRVGHRDSDELVVL
jgi:hypothetical protein